MRDEIFRTRNDFFYLQIVSSYGLNFKRALESLKENGFINTSENNQPQFHAKFDEIKDESELDAFLSKNNFKGFSNSVLAAKAYGHILIVFSAMCLEALINDYCVMKISSSYFERIDKLDTLGKWTVIPKIITNNEIPRDSLCFQLLTELFKNRNGLVHPKSKEHGDNLDHKVLSKDINDFLFKKVPRSFLAVKEASFELHKIDPSFEYLNDYKWLWDPKSREENKSELDRFISSMVGRHSKD